MIKLIPCGAITATSIPLTYEVTEKLCKGYCINAQHQPIVNVVFSVTDTNTVGDTTYNTIQAVVTVTYLPKGHCATCGSVTNTFIETFVVGTSSTASVSSVAGYNEAAYVSTSNCNFAHGISAVGNVTITVA